MLKKITIIISLSFLTLNCDTTNSEINNPDEIFGYWKLDRIVYQSGEVLSPGGAEDELYWLGFRDLDVDAEGETHKKLTGGAYCNWADGWFTEEPDRQLNVTLICSRQICGIATQFCTGVTTSYAYTFENGKLVLSFITQSRGPGIIYFNSFDPTNGDL